MGFLSGKLGGNLEENGFCKTFMDKNHCAPEESAIIATKVTCTGKEKKIDECGALFDTSNCNHDQDVILQCFGGDGDTTGNAAIISAMAKRLPPKLGKLPLAPIIDLKCETTLNE